MEQDLLILLEHLSNTKGVTGGAGTAYPSGASELSNTKGVTSGAGSAYPSGTSEFTSGFNWCSCCSIVSFLPNIL